MLRSSPGISRLFRRFGFLSRDNASPFWIMLLLFFGRLDHGRFPALAHKTVRANPLLRGFTNPPCTGSHRSVSVQ